MYPELSDGEIEAICEAVREAAQALD
jgi:hypothetical protein